MYSYTTLRYRIKVVAVPLMILYSQPIVEPKPNLTGCALNNKIKYQSHPNIIKSISKYEYNHD